MYRVSFMRMTGPREFLVKGCQGRAATQTGLHMHFVHHHVWNTVVIMKYGNLPHPW